MRGGWLIAVPRLVFSCLTVVLLFAQTVPVLCWYSRVVVMVLGGDGGWGKRRQGEGRGGKGREGKDPFSMRLLFLLLVRNTIFLPTFQHRLLVHGDAIVGDESSTDEVLHCI